jgi:hypothetical protein
MRQFLDSLYELAPSELLSRAATVHGTRAYTEWQLAALLTAIERGRHYTECGCKSILRYGEKQLGIGPRKTRELLRVARICEQFELLSQAFRLGQIGWCKLREISRVVDEDNERKWLRYALRHSVRHVELAVAAPPASLRKPQIRYETPTLFEAVDDGAESVTFVGAASDESGDCSDEESQAMADDCLAQQQSTPDKPTAEKRELPDWLAIEEDAEELVPQPKMVRLSFVVTAEEYAVFEAAMRKAAGQVRKRVARDRLLGHMCKMYLASGDSRSRARYPVVVQINNGRAAYRTERGDLPVEAERVRSWRQKAERKARRQARKPAGTTKAEQPGLRNDGDTTEAVAAVEAALSNVVGAASLSAVAGQAGAPGVAGNERVPGAADEATALGAVGDARAPALASTGWASGAPGEVTRSVVASEVAVSHGPTTSSEVGDPMQRHPREVEQPTGRPRDELAEATETDVGATHTGEHVGGSTHVGRSHRKPPGAQELRQLMAHTGWACSRCGSLDYLEIHHKTPVSRGGGEQAANKEQLCRNCHRNEHASDFKDDPVFIEGRRRALERGQGLQSESD